MVQSCGDTGTLCLIVDLISEYRYRGEEERYKEYVQTIIRNIDTDELPPMISGLIILEVTALVDTAGQTGVIACINYGVDHLEIWRHESPDEYSEAYPNVHTSDEAYQLEQCEAYTPHGVIASQSIWLDVYVDVYVDDFIVSLTG